MISLASSLEEIGPQPKQANTRDENRSSLNKSIARPHLSQNTRKQVQLGPPRAVEVARSIYSETMHFASIKMCMHEENKSMTMFHRLLAPSQYTGNANERRPQLGFQAQ